MKNITRFRKLIVMAIGFVLVAAVSVYGLLAIIVQPEAVTIVRFEPLDPQISHQTVPFSTRLDDLNLPAYLEAAATIQAAQIQQSLGVTLPLAFSTFGVGGSVGTAQVNLLLGPTGVDLPVYNESTQELSGINDTESEETQSGEPDGTGENVQNTSYNNDPETQYPPYEPQVPDETEYENDDDEHNGETQNENDDYEYGYSQNEENEYELPEYDYEYREDDDYEEYEEDEYDEEPIVSAPDLPHVPTEPFYTQVPVTWHVSFVHTEVHGSVAELEFDGETVGQFVFTAAMASGYRLAAGVEMPTITVDVVFPFGAMAAVAPFALGNLVESGNIEGNLPWNFCDCGTLELGAGVLPHGNHIWPRRNELTRIVFTAPVIAGENISNLYYETLSAEEA